MCPSRQAHRRLGLSGGGIIAGDEHRWYRLLHKNLIVLNFIPRTASMCVEGNAGQHQLFLRLHLSGARVYESVALGQLGEGFQIEGEKFLLDYLSRGVGKRSDRSSRSIMNTQLYCFLCSIAKPLSTSSYPRCPKDGGWAVGTHGEHTASINERVGDFKSPLSFLQNQALEPRDHANSRAVWEAESFAPHKIGGLRSCYWPRCGSHVPSGGGNWAH